jgi:site-specific DNA-methyltransferase (adenine-specific)
LSIELNTIYNEDCLVGMKRIPDKSVDMILCDLPYGTTSCAWDEIIPFDKLWEQYERVLKKKGIIVLTATEPFTSKLIMSNVDLFKEKLTWIKHRASNFVQAEHRHMKYTEDVVVFGRTGTTYNRQMVPRTSPRVKQMHDSNWYSFIPHPIILIPINVRHSQITGKWFTTE